MRIFIMMTVASKATAGIPLPAMVAAVWGGFLYEGLFGTGADKGQERSQQVLEAWGQGGIELVIGASVFLPALWREVCAAWESGKDNFPGVLEYEVVSTLGTWLGDQVLATGQLPDTEVVQTEIRRLVQEFFDQHPGPAVREDGIAAGLGRGDGISVTTPTGPGNSHCPTAGAMLCAPRP
jgi:hypothetical protein